MRLRPLSVLLLNVIFALASPANKLNAQTTASGGLNGVVTDSSRAVVPDARVEIQDDAKGTIQSTKTDREGVYQFSFLSPERYTLKVTQVGFREEKRTISILLGPPVSARTYIDGLSSPFPPVRFAWEIVANTGRFRVFRWENRRYSLRFRLNGGEGGIRIRLKT
jgi:carboxypeptidase family protein